MPPSPSGDSLFHALLELQAHVLRGGAVQPSLERWLTLLLAEVGGEHGVLGVELPGPGASRRLQLLAATPPDLVKVIWEVALLRTADAPEPRSLEALVHLALSNHQPVSAEGPGEPLPDCVRVLPLEGGRVRGFVGFSQSPEGVPSEELESFRLLLDVGTSLLHTWHEAHPPLPPGEWEELEQLRQTLASVQEEVWSLDGTTGELKVSRRFREILGYTEDEAPRTLKVWETLCHPEDLPLVERSFQEHATGSTPYAEFEYRVRAKDGEWAWLRSRARVAARDARGRPSRLVGTDTDLTALKRSEERLGALIQAIPDLIFRQSVDGTFLDFSCSTTEETLLRPEDFVGRNMRDLPMPRHLVNATFAHIEQVAREGLLAVYDYEMDMPHGRQSYEARMVRSGPDEVVSIIRNVTERRLVEERQAQLIQAEKLASLGQMAAGLAHEINNPVSYVTSNLRALDEYVTAVGPLLRMMGEWLEAPEGEPRALTVEQLARMRKLWEQGSVQELLTDMPELLQESLTGTKRIKEIAQSLRVFAREDDGQAQAVDLNEELESTLRMVGTELKYKCEVKRDFGPLPLVTCPPTQIVQVFTNLLLNAAQAIETRGEIRIRTRQVDEEVVVEISDTGRGMTAETLSKLFTPFFTTKPRGQGTGLGLSISRDIITRQGGRIEVRSELGKGSTFTVHLPITPL